MRVTITSKEQVTIPVGVRRRLNLKPGHVLDIDESAPHLLTRQEVNQAAKRDALGVLEGALGHLLVRLAGVDTASGRQPGGGRMIAAMDSSALLAIFNGDKAA